MTYQGMFKRKRDSFDFEDLYHAPPAKPGWFTELPLQPPEMENTSFSL
jgi:hypothetical protein